MPAAASVMHIILADGSGLFLETKPLPMALRPGASRRNRTCAFVPPSQGSKRGNLTLAPHSRHDALGVANERRYMWQSQARTPAAHFFRGLQSVGLVGVDRHEMNLMQATTGQSTGRWMSNAEHPSSAGCAKESTLSPIFFPTLAEMKPQTLRACQSHTFKLGPYPHTVRSFFSSATDLPRKRRDPG